MHHRRALLVASLILLTAPLAVASASAGAAPAQDPPIPAACDDYTPGVITIRPTSVDPGESVVVEGTGRPGTTIEVTLRPPAGVAGGSIGPISVAVGADGTWSTTVTVPADAGAGAWIITAVDVECRTEVTAEVRVLSDATNNTPSTPSTPGTPGTTPSTPTSPQPAPNLAYTGTSLHLMVSIGFVLLTAGGLLLLRRSRDHHLA